MENPLATTTKNKINNNKQKKPQNNQCFIKRYNQYAKINCLKAQDKMKSSIAENVFGSLISTRLDRRSYQPTTCLNPRNFFLP
jgi:hypothetical protein